jgi:hypothetical protein
MAKITVGTDPSASGKVTAELDLWPGKHNPADSGKPGGEFPFWVAVKGDSTVYVSSDREIVVVDINTFTPTITARIHANGNPNKTVLNRAQTRLHVTVDNEDALYVIYPTIRSGADLRQNRAALLQTLEPKAAANSQNQQ